MTNEQIPESGHKNRTKKSPVPIITAEANKQVRSAFVKVAQTQAGRDALRWIMMYCGFKHSSLTMTEEGVLLIDAIVHNEAKRATWLDIRKNIPPELLNLIEREEENSPDESKQKKKS